jgi:hypothetical protein
LTFSDTSVSELDIVVSLLDVWSESQLKVRVSAS